jgi:hypothetical protein
MIASWPYINHDLVTQFINGHDGPQVENLLDPTQPALAQLQPPVPLQTDLVTPRSMNTTYDFQTPTRSVSQPASVHSTPTFNGVIIPSTFADFNSWMTTSTGNWLGSTAITPPAVTDSTAAFHTETRLADGRPSILIDPGSVGNLGGDRWARIVAKCALEHGRKPTQVKRDRPLNVSGVGNGSQACTHNCLLPVAFRRTDDAHSRGTFQVPVVPNSDLPGLLGLQSLRDRRAILDCTTLQLHFLGPGDCDLTTVLPPGTESYQCELAPSGHMVLPCGEYRGVDREERGRLDTGPEVALHSSSSPSARPGPY